MTAGVSISQITTAPQSFADDLDAYRAAGVDGIGVWEMKLDDDSLERFRASGLEAATAQSLAALTLTTHTDTTSACFVSASHFAPLWMMCQASVR